MCQHYSYLAFEYFDSTVLKCHAAVLIFDFKHIRLILIYFLNSFTKGGLFLKYYVKCILSGFLKTFEKEFVFNPYALDDPSYINSYI